MSCIFSSRHQKLTNREHIFICIKNKRSNIWGTGLYCIVNSLSQKVLHKDLVVVHPQNSFCIYKVIESQCMTYSFPLRHSSQSGTQYILRIECRWDSSHLYNSKVSELRAVVSRLLLVLPLISLLLLSFKWTYIIQCKD